MAKPRDDLVGQCQRGGQPRRLDTVEVDEPGDAMILRALHDKIGRGFARAADLGADAGIARLQGAVAQPRPIAPYRRGNRLRAAVVDAVTDPRNPLDIGSKPRLAG